MANPGKKLDDAPFWMVGEVFPHGVMKDAYYTDGGFDSLINFDFQRQLNRFIRFAQSHALGPSTASLVAAAKVAFVDGMHTAALATTALLTVVAVVLAAVAAAKYYIDYSDFSVWVLRVHRVRWVGGYGRMDSATGADYVAAQPDPIRPLAAGAIAHLNADHAESLAQMARGAVGVCCQKVSEAAAMIQGGIADVLVTNDPWMGTGHLFDFVTVSTTFG